MAAALASLAGKALRTRWLVRSPIWVYRWGLGFVFGSRLLMLEHLGRRTGARRYVVLEVVEQPAPNQYVVVSGFGRRSQWYRNILANPAVRVSCGFERRRPATATPLSEEDSAAVLRRYADEHPRAWSKLRPTIEAAVGQPVETLPMVLLEVSGAR